MSHIPRRRHAPTDISLSPAMEDYLKAVFTLTRDQEAASTQGLAERLQVSPASATKMVKRLAESRLVVHEPYQGVRLTEAGRKIAVEIVRHHRLLELYLTQALGFTWDEVHEEAERLEHYISEKLEARICEFLGNPAFDPHGSPIPTLEGEIPRRTLMRLDQIPINELFEVARVQESEPDRLKSLGALGLVPGVSLVVYGRPANGKVHLRVGRSEHLLQPNLCLSIGCRPTVDETFPALELRLGELGVVTNLRSRSQTSLNELGIKLGTILERTQTGFSLDRDGQVAESELGDLLVQSAASEPHQP